MRSVRERRRSGLDVAHRAVEVKLVAELSLEDYEAMRKDPPLRPSETILLTGALGSVGRTAVFAAKGLGVRVWAGVRRNQKDAAEALGVDGVVALDGEIDWRRLPTLDGIADTVGRP